MDARRRPRYCDVWMKRVAYLLLADNVSGPLPIRLPRVNQPVVRTRNAFSPTHSPRLAYTRADFSHSRRDHQLAPFLTHSSGFLRNKNAALPVRTQKSPLTLSGLKKNGSRMALAATNFRAPSECRGYRRTG